MLPFTQLRNRHFLEAAKKIIDSLPKDSVIDITSVAIKAASSPAPHYYCTFIYALRMIYVYRHSKQPMKEGRRKQLWRELNQRVDDHIAEHGGTVTDALQKVLSAGNASQFFLSPVTAANLVRRYYDYKTRTILLPDSLAFIPHF